MTRTPVILDTNIYISYLLSLEPTGVVAELIHSLFDGVFVPAIPPEQILELGNSVRSKRYLRERIPEQRFNAFLKRLLEFGVALDPLIGDFPRIFRDPRDDYLYAYAQRDNLSVIVSGDRDVLAEREQFDHPEILTPQEFRDLITRWESRYP